MSYLPLPDNAARQAIDSAAVFLEWLRLAREAKKFAGGMYFKREGRYEYLVKTSPDNRQTRLGPRDERVEEMLKAFTEAKRATASRLRALRERLRESERLNKALRVGRALNVVVNVLNELELEGIGAHFTVVGTYALYAYEAAALVRIGGRALATQDVDLQRETYERLQFVTNRVKLDGSVLKLLQRADPSFQRTDGHPDTVVNDKGFVVAVTESDSRRFRLNENEDDLRPVLAQGPEAFLNVPRCEQVVFSTTGRMALMRTVSPVAFVEFKRRMASLDNRPARKRLRDKLQAGIVQQLLDAKALQP